MKARIEKELQRVAEATGEGFDNIKASFERMKEDGVGDMAAVSMIKAEHRQALHRINAVYRTYPLYIRPQRKVSFDDAEFECVDILGAFYGPTQRGGNNEPFLMMMSLRDEQMSKADTLEIGEPFKFKGALDTVYNKIYMNYSGEFKEDKANNDLPPIEDIITPIVEELPALEDIYRVDDQDNLIYDQQKLAVTGYVMDSTEYSGGFVMHIQDLGVDEVTVWPPDGCMPEDFEQGQRVLIFGKLRFKDDGAQISAYAIATIAEE
jgi:hypothetical protein